MSNPAFIAKELAAQKTAPPAPSILDLPDDVKKNICGYEDLELDEMLLQCIGRYNAAINADRIIMTLYTSYKKSPPRTKVLDRLRSLTKAGSIKKVEGVRSMYSRV